MKCQTNNWQTGSLIFISRLYLVQLIKLFQPITYKHMGNQLTKPQSSPPPPQQPVQSSLPNPSPNPNKPKKSVTSSSSSISNRSKLDVFMVYSVEEISLDISIDQFQFYWIDMRVYSDQMVNAMHLFNRYLLNFQQFNNPQEFINQLKNYHGNKPIRVIAGAALDQQVFKAINNCRYVERIIMFCQNNRKATDLQRRYPKIIQCAHTALEVLEMAPYPSTYQQNMFFMVPEDVLVIHKYWINYYCLLKHEDWSYALEHFVELGRRIYPEEENLIREFEMRYREGNNRERLVKEWMFRDSFYWSLVENLPKITNDPKKLAYLRSPVKDIHNAIKNYYNGITKQVFNTLRVVYIVVELSDQEKRKIESCLNNYMIFSSFVRGFTNKKAANAYTKTFRPEVQQNVFVFDVTIPAKSSLHQDLDYGFILLDEKRINDRNFMSFDIAFNIFNYFKITDVSVNLSTGVLMYGGLAEAYKKRERAEYRLLLKQNDNQSLAHQDSITIQSGKVKSQVSALRISGRPDDSIICCNQRINQLSQINNAQSLIEIDQVLIEKGASLLLNNQPSDAIQTYRLVRTQRHRVIASMRIVGIYLDQNDQAHAREQFERIMDKIDSLRQQGLPEEYFRAKHFRYRLLMMTRNFGEAFRKYKDLKNEILEFYDYKKNTLPFWDEIIKNLNQCSESNLNAPVA